MRKGVSDGHSLYLPALGPGPLPGKRAFRCAPARHARLMSGPRRDPDTKQGRLAVPAKTRAAIPYTSRMAARAIFYTEIRRIKLAQRLRRLSFPPGLTMLLDDSNHPVALIYLVVHTHELVYVGSED